MARPRLNPLVADVSGASAKNPQRHRGRHSAQSSALGDPPSSLTPAQRRAWVAFAAELPWLKGSHRALLRLACVLRARVESTPDIGVTALSAYSAILSKLGATPVDETRVGVPDADEADPTDRFFQ